MSIALPRPALRLALLALALASCTSNVQVWRDPGYRPEPVKRVLVVADGPDRPYQAAAEAAMARLVLAKGFQVATASDAAGPGAFDVDRPDPAVTKELATIGVVPRGTNIDLGKVVAYARGNDVDLALVETISRTNCGDYGQPGCMTASARAYAVRTRPDAPVWTATATASDFDTVEGGAGATAQVLFDDLLRSGILIH
jgi:hypothetical protein